MVDTYTHKELAALCAVSETTIKSYRRKFPGFIPVLTRGKPIRFKKEAGDVCLKIRDCFDKGMSVNETAKVLKQHFKEYKVAPRQGAAPTAAAVAAPQTSSVLNPEYMEKFFQTAGQMMQGMASLATAQAKANQRLAKLEDAVTTLVDLESRNSELFAEVLHKLNEAPAQPTATAAAPAAEAAPQEAAPVTEPKAEKKVKRKIINVKSPEGTVKSYAFEKMEENKGPSLERPSDAFLNTPIVIMNEQGEFLGVPGRLPLSGFVEILVREAEEGGSSHSDWRRQDENWIFTMQAPNQETHELYFMSTTTPRGNLVVLLDRLDVNGKETSSQFLQEFFKQMKDKV
ncbi:MerR family transcriptional regulator [Pseudodesulfovibrio sp. zrk46]|uniref:MerR family transcriptional regulator n=1 Tax=Pseudodesulfovibrio sp. zrk46 TaxID=2725288 RepID=UPI001449DE4A|nr:MerR family transcriptional regulator [Pseudodesulfovibrio sp. zrk46]QJB55968.1 MerR family transcriptional regulator [Pseudodesulfovibrio sp. zrk46]